MDLRESRTAEVPSLSFFTHPPLSLVIPSEQHRLFSQFLTNAEVFHQLQINLTTQNPIEKYPYDASGIPAFSHNHWATFIYSPSYQGLFIKPRFRRGPNLLLQIKSKGRISLLTCGSLTLRVVGGYTHIHCPGQEQPPVHLAP